MSRAKNAKHAKDRMIKVEVEKRLCLNLSLSLTCPPFASFAGFARIEFLLFASL
jgi:hypothetical protein